VLTPPRPLSLNRDEEEVVVETGELEELEDLDEVQSPMIVLVAKLS
jgi:hypothetical protein